MALENAERSRDFKAKIVHQLENKETQLEIFAKYVERKFGIKLDDYWKLHDWSCKNFPEFWECVWHYFGIVCSQPFTEVFDRSRSFDNMEWFKGARLNYAENVFKYKDSHVALIATDSSDNEEFITYMAMYEEVCHYAASLRNMGVKKGDIVGCYMPNKKEAVFAFLATASIGAVWCAAFPILGIKAVVSRFHQISFKVIFTSGNFFAEGKEIKMVEKLKAIAEGLPSLEKLIFVPSKEPGVIEDISHIPKCCNLKDFLEKSKKEYENNPWVLEYEQVPFDHPLSITFTSGTTGLPKGIVHGTGVFVTFLKDCGLHQDITRKDVLLNNFTSGGVSWNMCVHTLHLGVTLCLYEGSAYQETPTRFWDLVDRFGITSVLMWSCNADDMEKNGFIPTENHKLTTLRQIFPGSSVMKPHTYDFFPKIIPGVFATSLYGMTEFGMAGGVNRNLPVHRGENQCFSLGMDVKCLDRNGKEVVGAKGSVGIANPSPTMPVQLLHDETKKKLRETYLSQYGGYWYTGDEIWINPVTKGFILYGRCDETIKLRSANFSCAEIYFALEEFPGILDSVCVSQFNREREERALLFVKMKPGNKLTGKLQEEIRRVIADSLSYKHVPNIIMQVPDIPYNMTGKKLNITVRKLVNKMAVQNEDFVMNPESLEFYKQLDLGDF